MVARYLSQQQATYVGMFMRLILASPVLYGFSLIVPSMSVGELFFVDCSLCSKSSVHAVHSEVISKRCKPS